MQRHHLIEQLQHQIQSRGDAIALSEYHAGSSRHWRWREAGEEIRRCAAALIEAGVAVQDRVGIFSVNRPEWTLADLAILSCRAVVVPIYPTHTLAQARYVIEDAGIELLFVGDQAQFELALPLLQQGVLKQLVVFNPDVAFTPSANCVRYTDFIRPGIDQQAALQQRAAGFDMADLVTLIYTSGTTGEPKGVMLDMANFAAALRLHDRRLHLGHDDVSLAILPLSHVFERAWSYYVLYRGAHNVYIRDPMAVMTVIESIRPTVMCAVPRVWEKAHTQILAKVEQAPAPRKALFRWAIEMALKRFACVQHQQSQPWTLRLGFALADRLVLSKLRQRFGGRIRFLPVAGARLADEVQRFFIACGLPIKYGFGLTETCATVSCFEEGSFPIGTVGTPLDEIEIKLGDDDEILIRAPTVMRGYYRKPQQTAEVLSADGWFHSGDAGHIDEQGNLIFTERLKELCKTSNGKYVAPQLVEGVAAQSPYIEQVAIIADERHFVSALIYPNLESLRTVLPAQAALTDTELVSTAEAHALIEQALASVQTVLARHEQIKRFTLLAQPFSMQNGELTPTLKLRRKVVMAHYAEAIDAMYRAPRPA